MARTRLFGQLRRIAARALAERHPATPRVDAGRAHLTRRQLTAGALQLAAAGALAACSGDDSGKGGQDQRVVVVGAGIAGLHCAYRLQQAGVDVTVYEASTRVGGRMFTARDDAYDGQVFELGGELIDTGHVNIRQLAEELQIELDDSGTPAVAGIIATGPAPTSSGLEDVVLDLILRGGFAHPDVNVPLILGGRRYIPDFRWPAQRLVLEADGARWHDHRLAREDDRERQAILEADGERVVRVRPIPEPHTDAGHVAA